jgi:hypothetical protein
MMWWIAYVIFDIIKFVAPISVHVCAVALF